MKLISLLLISLCLVGCGTIREKFGAKAQPFITQTNDVPEIVFIPATTNLVHIPAQVNPAGEIVQEAGVVEVVNPSRTITNWSKQITVDVNPLWDKGITGARSLNTKFNPTPSAPFVEWGLAALSAGLGWWARVATKKANKKQDLLETVITGVEEANLPAVKESIAKVSRQWQNRDALEAEVQKLTKN
jgi:hypothetical protein